MKLNRLEELDNLFKGWTFNDMVFSKFWANIPSAKPHAFKGIPFQKEYDFEGINVYNLDVAAPKNEIFDDNWAVPDKFTAISKNVIDNLDATVYEFKRFTKLQNSSDAFGWGCLFEFPSIISNGICINIELENNPIDKIVMNITFENRLLSLRYNPMSIIMKGLNIHHTHYTRGCKPWEYENDSLVTLCEHCHKKRHENSRIPLYDQDKRLISNLTPCDRCGGSGYLPQYKHVAHGICFKCYGEGVVFND